MMTSIFTKEKKDEKKDEKKKGSSVTPYLFVIIVIVFVIWNVYSFFSTNWNAVILEWLGIFGVIAVGIGAYVACKSVSSELSDSPRISLKILIIIVALFLIYKILTLTGPFHGQ